MVNSSSCPDTYYDIKESQFTIYEKEARAQILIKSRLWNFVIKESGLNKKKIADIIFFSDPYPSYMTWDNGVATCTYIYTYSNVVFKGIWRPL